MTAHARHLKAMGIDVWVPRDAAVPDADEVDSDGAAPAPSLIDLEADVRACVRCELHRSRTHTVFGAGNTDADWMFGTGSCTIYPWDHII